MPPRDERIRRLVDTAPPLTLDEVTARPYPTAIMPKSRGGRRVRVAAAGLAAAALVGGVVWAVSGQAHHPNQNVPTVVVPAPTPPPTALPTATPQAQLKGADSTASDGFGASVAIWGDTAVVGAYGHDGGRAYVFTRTAAGWRQAAELKGADTASGDQFGTSVAISGNTVVVGAPGHANSAGRAYLFTMSSAGWKQVAELKGADTAANDGFGTSVAVSGATAVAGAPFHAASGGTPYSGAVYLFSQKPAGWSQVGELAASPALTGPGELGEYLAISGPTLVVTTYGSGAGRALVLTESAGGWKRSAELSGPTIGNDFASFAALSGTTAVVGGDPHQTVAYVFAKTAAGWQPVSELSAGTTGYSNSVATAGTTVLMGAAGGVYVFRA
jgi:hypothetical protein